MAVYTPRSRKNPICGSTHKVHRGLVTLVAGWLLVLCQLTWPACAGEVGDHGARRAAIKAIRNLVIYETTETSVRADVYRLDDDETYPIVIMIHGGAWSSGDKSHLLNHAHEMAHAGFVAVCINYRLAPIHRFPSQIEDCRAALKWAAEHADEWEADPARIAVWGYSAGGHLGGLLVADPQPDEPKICVAVLGGAPCEFSFMPEQSLILAPVMGGSREAVPEIYRRASPLEFVSKDVCPIFFFHGTSDNIVPPTSSRMMYDRLKELQVETVYHPVDGQGHLVTFFDAKSRRLAIEFIRKHLPPTTVEAEDR